MYKPAKAPHTPRKRRSFALLVGLPVAVVAASSIAWAMWRPHSAAHAGMRYVRSGFGGYVPLNAPDPQPGPDYSQAKTPLARLILDFGTGKYAQCVLEAKPIVAAGQDRSDPALLRDAADAALISAYAQARQKQYEAAQAGFALANSLAADLPDGGARAGIPGQPPEPTIAEEAAFQQIVCAGAEGKKAEAESGYIYFLKRYPQSILVQASLKRIARFHGGDLPKAAQLLWKHDENLQVAAAKAKMRSASLCGPECLAELLRRKGETVNLQRLAAEAKTDENGTSIAGLCQAARQHGAQAQGQALTGRGLQAAKLPLIALVHPGHFVIVEKVDARAVQYWDPDAKGPGKAAEAEMPAAQWEHHFEGAGVAIQESGGRG